MNSIDISLRNPKALIAFLLSLICLPVFPQESGPLLTGPGVSVLLVDTDHPSGKIDEGVYGQFLEHINHSVVDGLFAEQVQGYGFEGKDFEVYWKPFGEKGSATVEEQNSGTGRRACNCQQKKDQQV